MTAIQVAWRFGRQTPGIKLGQLAESLIRLARFIVCIRLHAEDWSVEQGVRFFRDEAYMEEASARREAERGTFDPMYLVYSVGKLALLKLRQDYHSVTALLRTSDFTAVVPTALPLSVMSRDHSELRMLAGD